MEKQITNQVKRVDTELSLRDLKRLSKILDEKIEEQQTELDEMMSGEYI